MAVKLIKSNKTRLLYPIKKNSNENLTYLFLPLINEFIKKTTEYKQSLSSDQGELKSSQLFSYNSVKLFPVEYSFLTRTP